MIRDVFYLNKKPNVHPRERPANSVEHARQLATTEHFWVVNEYCSYKNFDWEWDFDLLPGEDVWAEDHNNIWPSQHQKDSGTWLCPKIPPLYNIYRNDVEPVIRKREKNDNWIVENTIDETQFDFSWHPDPASPPYVYQFGTIADKNEGPRYVTPGSDGDIIVYMEMASDITVSVYEIETTLGDLVKKHTTEVFWATRKNINYDTFDFNWRPEYTDGSWDYVNVFGSPESDLTQTYFVNAKSYLKGNTNLKFIEQTNIDEQSLAKLFKKPDMFFVDRYNQESNSRFDEIKNKFPAIQKTRFVNNWVDTINRCAKKSTTEMFWVLDSQLDYSNFDFDYYPNPWQMKMLTVFGTQWSRWGTTFLVNKETFPEDTKYISIVEHIPAINFVKDRKATATNCYHDIVLIDHSNTEAKLVEELLALKANTTTVKYDGSYLRTLRNIVDSLPEKKDHYVWICSSVCDYTNFDFTYISDPFAKDQLHVFPSGSQQFGDTFLLDVNKARAQLATITSLEKYEKINFNQTMRVNRLPEPVIIVSDDTHVNAVSIDVDFPYATFISETDKDIITVNEPMNLWSPRTKNILVMSEGATKITVPKEAKQYVKRELYDYPYIKRSERLAKSIPLDIVFLSNGEVGAEENYEHLLRVTNKLSNRVVRVDGVNGRVQAYHAALEASNTPWAFTVFAKLRVNEKFDWSWQPDRMQIPKHYIFYAENPVNGLVYGHQGLVVYNKELVLNTQIYNIDNLDFTLAAPHEVIPQLSGVAMFNTDPWSTWKTSFREVLKLIHYSTKGRDPDSGHRLEAWLTQATGAHSEWSILGAKDAKEMYKESSGTYDRLIQSFEWDWLRKYFNQKYS